jgi:hypothetical protein
MHRRRFLKGTGAALGSLPLAGCSTYGNPSTSDGSDQQPGDSVALDFGPARIERYSEGSTPVVPMKSAGGYPGAVQLTVTALDDSTVVEQYDPVIPLIPPEEDIQFRLDPIDATASQARIESRQDLSNGETFPPVESITVSGTRLTEADTGAVVRQVNATLENTGAESVEVNPMPALRQGTTIVHFPFAAVGDTVTLPGGSRYEYSFDYVSLPPGPIDDVDVYAVEPHTY